MESPANTLPLGELVIEEADDGSTALQALKVTTADGRQIHDVNADLKSPEFECKGLEMSFDLIFMDYVMTTMNGPEAVQIMRRDMNFSGGIIGVTGNALPSDLTYFEQCGADLVITKPLTNKKLMDAVQSVTQTRKNSCNILE